MIKRTETTEIVVNMITFFTASFCVLLDFCMVAFSEIKRFKVSMASLELFILLQYVIFKHQYALC